MKVYRITPDRGLCACTEKNINGVIEWIKHSEVGHVMTIRVREMSEEEYNSLPEYTGP